MSNISVAVQLRMTGDEPIEALEERCIRSRAVGFDYILLDCPVEHWKEVPTLQRATGVKVIGLEASYLEFSRNPETLLQACAALSVPDLVLHDGQVIMLQQEERPHAQPSPPVRISWAVAEAGGVPTVHGDRWAYMPDTRIPGAPDMIRQYAGQVPLVLLNDIFPPSEGARILGQGGLDWEQVFDAGEEAAVEWYVVGEDSLQWETPASLVGAYQFLAKHA